LPHIHRVLNFLKIWIRKDFATVKESNILPSVKDFVNNVISVTMPPNATKEIQALIASKEVT
jgi:hypothetical protein